MFTFQVLMPHNDKTNILLQKVHVGYFREWIEQIQQNLGLTYLPQEDSPSNLCYQHADEVRDEYKTHFNAVDFAFFLLGMGIEKEDSPHYKSKIPSTTQEFWDLVNQGNNKNQSS